MMGLVEIVDPGHAMKHEAMQKELDERPTASTSDRRTKPDQLIRATSPQRNAGNANSSTA
jgi:hypothetical protein